MGLVSPPRCPGRGEPRDPRRCLYLRGPAPRHLGSAATSALPDALGKFILSWS